MNLSRHLVDRGDEVFGLSRSAMRSKPYTYGLEDEKRFRYQQIHIGQELPLLMNLLDNYMPDVIINFAAQCEVANSWVYPLDYYETNLMALVRLTNELETRSWFKKFVQIGSSEVYGSVESPASEEAPVKPSSPYAVSKAAFDAHLKAIAKHQKFPAIIVMPSNGYCEGQTLNRIIPKTIISCLTHKKFPLQGGGVARKSYLHGDDISRAILKVCADGRIGEVYNCGPEQSIGIRALVAHIAGVMGKTLEEVVEIAPERLGQDSQYLLDSSKMKAMGWRPRISLEHGIHRMIKWVEKYPELWNADQTYRHRP